MDMAKKTASRPAESVNAKPDAPGSSPLDPASSSKATSKSQAARSAIREGIENPTKAVAFIKQRFGIDMSPPHFSAVKSQLKKKEETAAAPKGKPGRKPKAPVEGYLSPPPKQPASGEDDFLDASPAIKPLI